MENNRYNWAAVGDVNAFFGLMLDNIAGLVLLVSMLAGIYGFPEDFAIRYMVPGTAIGVLVGDLMFFVLAFTYAARTGKTDVTAMPLGLDTPSTIGMVLLVLGPSYTAGIADGLDEQAAAMRTWHIGMCAIFLTGILKGVMAFGSGWIHRVFPRAGLLGSLAAIALVLISFSQMPEMAANPIVGFTSLVIVLATLIARQALPFRVPGALGAVLVGCVCWYLMLGAGKVTGLEFFPHGAESSLAVTWFPTEWFEAFRFEWLNAFPEMMPYLGYIIPFGIVTVIGGIDCAESAASVGDDFHTPKVIGIEAIATLLASLCGGVIQTTPYIGHPAYKAMGGRAAYTLATALFIGGAGLIGYFSLLFQWIPLAAVLPILIFIGVEITAQSFHATPRRHYAAIAIGCLPAIAKLVVIFLGRFVDDPSSLRPDLVELWLQLSVLAGGFIFTSLIWASATAAIIDRRFNDAAIYWLTAAGLSFFGLMHSPLVGDQMFWPWDLFTASFSAEQRKIVIEFMVAYILMAGLMWGLGALLKDRLKVIETDEAYEQL